MNWYIGQIIVCVKSHSKGWVKENQVYDIQALRAGCCATHIDVGMKGQDMTGSGLFQTNCCGCNKRIYNGTDNTLWFDECLFAPLDTLDEQIKEALTTSIEI